MKLLLRTAAPKPAIMKPIWLTVEYARTPLMSVVVKASVAPTMAVKTPIHVTVANQNCVPNAVIKTGATENMSMNLASR